MLGALHALEPGHGKTVVAAYLVGSKGRIRDAITLGGVVTFTHTFSIILLGILTSVAATYFVPETVHEVMGVFSGLLILAVGIWMLRRRFALPAPQTEHNHGRSRALPASLAATAIVWQRDPDYSKVDVPAGAPSRAASHSHGEIRHAHELASARHHHHGLDDDFDGHNHPSDEPGHVHATTRPDHDDGSEHAHPHDHHSHADHDHPHSPATHTHGGRAHSHAPVDHDRLGLRGLVALGISGGIVPCPAALALLLAAAAAGNVITGVGLVVVFSLGLATVLIAIGITMVKAASFAGQRLSGGLTDRLSRHASAVSAIVVTLLGIAATARALLEVAGIVLL